MLRRMPKLALFIALFLAGSSLWLSGALFRHARAQGSVTCTVPSAEYASIQSAVDDPSCDVINLLAGNYEGRISVDRSLAIHGQGSDATIISGQEITRSFTIGPGSGPVTLTQMSIQHGNAIRGGGIYHAGQRLHLSATTILSNSAQHGGGLFVAEGSNLTTLDSTFRKNQATSYWGGGAILAWNANVSFRNTLFEENSCERGPGGAVALSQSRLTLVNSTLRLNASGAGESGGAIHTASGTLQIQDTEFLENHGRNGGAISAYGSVMTISNTEFFGNSAVQGGALELTALGTSHLFSTTLAFNQASQKGGAIRNFSAVLTLTDSILDQNTVASGAGGGLINDDLATTVIERSTFSRNQALETHSGSVGGAAANEGGELTVVDSLLYSNTSGYVGGALYIYDEAVTKLINSTLSGNASDYDGAALFVDSDSLVTVLNSTIVGNQTPGDEFYEGGALLIGSNGNSILELANSIVAANEDRDCGGYKPITSLGHNLIGDGSCALDAVGDRSQVNPLLGSLADNGGSTLTHALLPGSPAIDGAGNAHCPATDQRGAPRPKDGDGNGIAQCDIGAVEAQFVTRHLVLPLVIR